MCKDRIEKGGIANRALHQLIHFLRRLGADEGDTDRQENKKKDGRKEKKGLDFQSGFPFDYDSLEVFKIIIG